MPFNKGKYLARSRAYQTTPKSDMRMFPPSDHKLQGICINETASGKYSYYFLKLYFQDINNIFNRSSIYFERKYLVNGNREKA